MGFVLNSTGLHCTGANSGYHNRGILLEMLLFLGMRNYEGTLSPAEEHFPLNLSRYK